MDMRINYKLILIVLGEYCVFDVESSCKIVYSKIVEYSEFLKYFKLYEYTTQHTLKFQKFNY